MINQKLKKNEEFKLVFSTGNKKMGKYIIIYTMLRQQDINRIGIIVKKNIGNAVQRNKIKRVLREIWRNRCVDLISGYDVIVLAKKRIVQASYKEIEMEFEKLIQHKGYLSKLDSRMSLNG